MTGSGWVRTGRRTRPIEQLASFRALPNTHVFRPADALETAECWEIAIRRSGGPSLILLSRQALMPLRQDASENRCLRGGYVLQEADGPRQATLIATGVGGRDRARGTAASRRDRHRRGRRVPAPAGSCSSNRTNATGTMCSARHPRVGIEAASGFGWERWTGAGGLFIGMTGFGASAPHADLYRHFGITPEAITAAVRRRVFKH